MKKDKIKKHKLLLRHLTLDDYDNIAALMEHVYGNLGGAWKKEQYASQITRFPQGQIVIEDNGQLVAAALSMVGDYARFGDVHTYAQITGDGYLTHHNPLGDTLFCASAQVIGVDRWLLFCHALSLYIANILVFLKGIIN